MSAGHFLSDDLEGHESWGRAVPRTSQRSRLRASRSSLHVLRSIDHFPHELELDCEKKESFLGSASDYMSCNALWPRRGLIEHKRHTCRAFLLGEFLR